MAKVQFRRQLDMNTLQSWFALQTMPRNEMKINYLLEQKGYECFTPTYRQKRKWSDRTVEINFPLFPTYVFCCLSSSAIGNVIATRGVTRIVGFGGKPAEIAVEEIEALRLLAPSNLLREPWRYLPEGTPVVVETGPLAGVQGIICPDENRRQLIISITLLQRSVAIQLDEDTVISVLADHREIIAGLSVESELAVRLLRRP
jgi:transcription antitermination factor NusG